MTRPESHGQAIGGVLVGHPCPAFTWASWPATMARASSAETGTSWSRADSSGGKLALTRGAAA